MVFPNPVMDIYEVCTLAEIVIVLALFPIPIPAPAEIETLLEVPLSTKLVAAGTEGPTTVTTCKD